MIAKRPDALGPSLKGVFGRKFAALEDFRCRDGQPARARGGQAGASRIGRFGHRVEKPWGIV
jgi:hypothetical protein